MPRRFESVIGFDDSPFPRFYKGDIPIIGTVYTGLRLDGIITGRIRKDGANATDNLALLVQRSKFAPQIKLVMLQGIALGGFNVVDIHGLSDSLGIPVLVVTRRAPDLNAIRAALLGGIAGGTRKWKLIERAGEVEPVGQVFVQRAGLTLREAAQVIERFACSGTIPEPLRVAHLIAGGLAKGQSRGRA